MQQNRDTKIKKILSTVLVDEQDRHFLLLPRLFISRQGYIAQRNKKNKITHLFLHHMIIGKPKKGFVVDHKNGNVLDNRRENLHFTSYEYNSSNKKKRKDSKQLLKAIQELPSGRFSVKVTNGKRLGTFDLIEDAKECYNKYIFNRFNMPLYVTTS